MRVRRDFQAATRARSTATPGFVLQSRKRSTAEAERVDAALVRLGLTASRKVGGSVVRNRAKRRLRHLADEVLAEHGRAGWDYVLVARADETVRRTFASMRAELVEALGRAHTAGPSRQKTAPRRNAAPEPHPAAPPETRS